MEPDLESLKRVYAKVKELAQEMRKAELGGRFEPKPPAEEAPDGAEMGDKKEALKAAVMGAPAEVEPDEEEMPEESEEDEKKARFAKLARS